MDWNELKFLLAVSRNGQAGLAAEELGVSHATVSRKIAELEKILGVNLVDRSGLAWTVTPIGQRIAEQAARMENCVLETKSVAKNYGNDLSGIVHISAPNILITELLANALAGFSEKYPKIKLAISAQDSIANLRNREADIALRFTEEPDPNLVGVEISQFTWSFFAQTEKQKQIDEQLDGSTTLPKTTLLTSSLDEGFPSWAHGIFHPECDFNYVYGYREKAFLAAFGMGVALLPDRVGEKVEALSPLTKVSCSRVTRLWLLTNADVKTSLNLRVECQRFSGPNNYSEK